jgi:hypothetical protein
MAEGIPRLVAQRRLPSMMMAMCFGNCDSIEVSGFATKLTPCHWMFQFQRKQITLPSASIVFNFWN